MKKPSNTSAGGARLYLRQGGRVLADGRLRGAVADTQTYAKPCPFTKAMRHGQKKKIGKILIENG